MSILKKKIAHAHKIHFGNDIEKVQLPQQTSNTNSISAPPLTDVFETRPHKSFTKQSIPKKSKKIREGTCQNIVKNYSRAFVSFALSPLSLSYLSPILAQEELSLGTFYSYISDKKDKINCIKNLRAALLIKPNDSDEIAACKRVFSRISEVFLKSFSVNWLFNSKIENKVIHLNYRFKLLRRIRTPEYFTYLEEIKFE